MLWQTPSTHKAQASGSLNFFFFFGGGSLSYQPGLHNEILYFNPSHPNTDLSQAWLQVYNPNIQEAKAGLPLIQGHKGYTMPCLSQKTSSELALLNPAEAELQIPGQPGRECYPTHKTVLYFFKLCIQYSFCIYDCRPLEGTRSHYG